MSNFTYYAVRRGRRPGIYTNWDEAKAQVAGFSGQDYKGFDDLAAAIGWMQGGGAIQAPAGAFYGASAPLTPEAALREVVAVLQKAGLLR